MWRLITMYKEMVMGHAIATWSLGALLLFNELDMVELAIFDATDLW